MRLMKQMRQRIAGVTILTVLAAGLLAGGLYAAADDATGAKGAKAGDDGFVSLFDGKSLDGWKANESPETFKVVDGVLCVNGQRAHLFYTGPVQDHEFKNFHFKAEVQTWPNSNSGIYFHTAFQDSGWPSKGFEVQVNNSFKTDPRKTGSLYAVKDVTKELVKDNEWFLYEIIVQGKQVTIKVNGETVNEYTVPEDYRPPKDMPGRKLSHGTFALQGHDPGSKVCYRNIMVKPLPD